MDLKEIFLQVFYVPEFSKCSRPGKGRTKKFDEHLLEYTLDFSIVLSGKVP